MDRVSNRISTREYAVHTEVAVSREMSEGTSQGRGMYYTCQQVRLADSNVVWEKAKCSEQYVQTYSTDKHKDTHTHTHTHRPASLSVWYIHHITAMLCTITADAPAPYTYREYLM